MKKTMVKILEKFPSIMFLMGFLIPTKYLLANVHGVEQEVNVLKKPSLQWKKDNPRSQEKLEQSWSQKKLRQFSKKILLDAERGDLKSVQKIVKALFKNSHGFDYIRAQSALYTYLKKAALAGKTKTVEFLLNHQQGDFAAWLSRGVGLNPKEMLELEDLLSQKIIKRNRDLSDLLKIVHGDAVITQWEHSSSHVSKKPLCLKQDSINSWKRILSSDHIHLPKHYMNFFFYHLISFHSKEKFLIEKMLQNYVEGKNNAPHEDTLSWLVPMPRDEPSAETIDDKRIEHESQRHANRSTYFKNLIREKPRGKERENLYQRVCKKLYAKKMP